MPRVHGPVIVRSRPDTMQRLPRKRADKSLNIGHVVGPKTSTITFGACVLPDSRLLFHTPLSVSEVLPSVPPYPPIAHIFIIYTQHQQSQPSAMSRNGGIEKKKPSSAVDSQKRSILRAVASYATCVEDEIEDLRHFRSWAQPKFAEYDVQLSRMRSEINELRRRADSTEVACSNIGGESPVTPQDTRTPEKKVQDDARIEALVTALRRSRNVQIRSEQGPEPADHEADGSTESDGISAVHNTSAQRNNDGPVNPAADDDDPRSPPHGRALHGPGKTSGAGDRQRLAALRRADGGRLGSPALARNRKGLSGRPCILPGSPGNFNLSFPSTPTQDPGDFHDAWNDSNDDEATLPPTPPSRLGNAL